MDKKRLILLVIGTIFFQTISPAYLVQAHTKESEKAEGPPLASRATDINQTTNSSVSVPATKDSSMIDQSDESVAKEATGGGDQGTAPSIPTTIELPTELLTKELFLQTKIGEKKQNITIGEKEELTLAVPTPVQSDQQTFLLQPTGEKNFQLIYAKENLLVVPQTDQTLKLVANTETDHATLEAADWQLVAADQVDAYYLRSSLGTLLSWDEATQRLELKPAGESDNLVFQLQLWPETETTDPSVPPTPEESTPAKKPSVPEKTDSEEDPGGTVPVPAFAQSQQVAAGVYQVTAAGLTKGLALTQRSTANGVGISLQPTNTSFLQQFEIESTTDGWYLLKNSYSGKYLDIPNASRGNSIPLQQYTGNQTDAQKFKFLSAGNGQVYIQSKLGTVLDRRGGASANGTVIQTYQLNETVAQKWQLTKQAEKKLVDVKNGEYQLTSYGTDKVLSIGSLTGANHAPLKLLSGTYSGTDKFLVEKQSDGWYVLRNSYSGKSLDVTNESSSNGAVIQQYTSKNIDAQKFRFIEADQGYVYLESKLGTVIERPGGSLAEGLVIKTYQWNQTAAQKWKLTEPGEPATAEVQSGATYFLTPGNNPNAVIEVSNGSQANSARVQIWTEAAVAHQKFIPEDLGDGWFKIKNAATGKVLDVTGGNKNPGVAVQQYTWNGTAAQRFRFIPANAGAVFIQSQLGTYLDVTGGKATNGTGLQTYSLNRSAAQQFKLTNLKQKDTLRTTILNQNEARITLYSPSQKKLEFQSWSIKGGQDDRLTTQAVTNPDGSISTKVNVRNFRDYGDFKTEITTEAGEKIAETSYQLTGFPAYGELKAENKNGQEREFVLQASILDHPDVKTVQFPVWSEVRGQDDIVWYNAQYNAGQKAWQTTVPIKNHKDPGKYHVHCYVVLKDGTRVYLRATSFQVTAPQLMGEIKTTTTTTGRFTVSLQATSLSGVEKIQVPVWSQANQSDIIWYTADKQADGTYQVVVDYRNHRYHTGTYTVHAYLTASNKTQAAINVGTAKVALIAGTTPEVKFLNQLVPAVKEICDKYNLYPSVMLAQAALESGYGRSELAINANNYFGIKGTYLNNQYYDKKTLEWINGSYVEVTARFRKYLFWKDSIEDNALKLRKGPNTNFGDPSWNPNFYAGSWRENARTYADATKALTGKYATAPDYHVKLDNLITRYHMTVVD